ncbi:TPA: single-stranded-DNA-specific exonuclease RecJ [Candidatus Gracilibacteria bacterium]|nr:single-stranded-DNA-specific exonuclease RecJ [Candidatus Gracilibacteria bacterium]
MMKKSLSNKIWNKKNETQQYSSNKSLYENFLDLSEQQESDFLSVRFEDFLSPFDFQDMRKAIDLLEEIIAKKERILIFGDYDLDGMSGTAVLFLALKMLGANVSYRLPSRADGYGLSQKFIDEAHEKNVKLFITTDCGVSNVAEVQKARDLGMNVIITDHHSVRDELPNANAILHPLVPNEPFVDKDLTGAGVAWYFARAMLQNRFGAEKTKTSEIELLEIALLGTIADCGILKGENRKIVILGLEKLKSTKNKGLLELMSVSRSDINNLTAETIAFFIAPRLNASGRLAHPTLSLELLLGNKERAYDLERLNKERQELVSIFLAEADEQVTGENENNQQQNATILVKSDQWPGGVIGLISGRLAEQYARPTIAFEITPDKITGSCRGPVGFNIATTLKEIEKEFPKYFYGCGGHAQAAGLSLYPEYFENFCEEFNARVEAKRGKIPPLPELTYLSDITANFTVLNIKELEKAQPFGIGNPAPCFLFSNCTIVTSRTVGKDKSHLSLLLKSNISGQNNLSAIWFRGGEFEMLLPANTKIDILAIPKVNEWNGQENISLQVVDVRIV